MREISHLSVNKDTNLGWMPKAIVGKYAFPEGAQTLSPKTTAPQCIAGTDRSFLISKRVVKLTTQGGHTSYSVPVFDISFILISRSPGSCWIKSC